MIFSFLVQRSSKLISFMQFRSSDIDTTLDRWVAPIAPAGRFQPFCRITVGNRDYHHQSHFEIDREAELPVTTEQAPTEAACSRYGTRVL